LKELTHVISRLDEAKQHFIKDYLRCKNQRLISSSYIYLYLSRQHIHSMFMFHKLLTKYIFLLTQISKGYGQS